VGEALQPLSNVVRYLNLLLWYAWPALPLAAWALWSKRYVLRTRPLALPIVTFTGLLLMLGLGVETSSAAALLLLPPLVLLAVPGVATLRRGAANAFDWFGMVTFSFLSLTAWIVWSALVFGWPQRLARQAVRLEPGFLGTFSIVACVFAATATIVWFWLIVTSPRAPLRGIMHWMAGLTLFWLLIATLWMPWIDFGKTYRPLSASLAKALPTKDYCIANANLPDSILASLDYFDGIRTFPLDDDASRNCHWLLLHGQARDPAAITAAGWRPVWEGKRPSDRRESEIFHLYRRDKRSAAPLSEIAVEIAEGEGAPR
jgi:4-amino-4-deoxy-L-arabinose transferase-like glycosyltransferase